MKGINSVSAYKILLGGLTLIFLAAYVFATSPTQNTPTIDSSDPDTNNTFADLIVTNQSTTDSDGDIVYNSITWLLNNETNISSIRPDDPNLILFMPMDGNSTEELMDYAGADDNATFYNDIKYRANCLGDSGCYDFDGVNGYITTPLSMNDGNFSVSLSFNPNLIQKSSARLIGIEDNTPNRGWHIEVDSAGLRFHTDRDSIDQTFQIDNQWHTIFVTWNNDTQTSSLYLEGVLVNSSTNGIINFTGVSNTLSVGISSWLNTNHVFNGSLDNIAIWNKTLTDDDVYNYYQASAYGNFTLNNSYTKYGDFWSAEIIPYDYINSGTPQNTSELYIDCLIPTENVIITEDTIFCGGIYYLNDSDTNGVLQIGANNIIIDGNNSILVGDLIINSYGIVDINFDNVIISNFTFQNYQQGIRLTSGVANSVISSNIFENSISQIRIFNSNSDNNIIENNFFINSTNKAIYLSNGLNNTIRNNIFNHTTSTTANNGDGNIYIDQGASGTVIQNNTFIDYLHVVNSRVIAIVEGSNSSYITENIFNDSNNEIMFRDSINHYIFNNTFENGLGQQWIYMKPFDGWELNNITIISNSFTNFSHAIRSYNTTDFHIVNNTFVDATTNYDGWNLGINIDVGSGDGEISGNTFTDIGCAAVFLRGVQNITVENNSVGLANINETSNDFRCWSDARAGIFISELYQTWTGDGLEQPNDNISQVSTYSSDNITVINNTFGQDVDILLRAQGITNLTHDLDNYWYISYQFPAYLIDKDEFFVSNSWDNVTSINSNFLRINEFGQSYMNPGGINQAGITFFKNYQIYRNANDTQTYTLNLYNLSDQDVKWFNGSVSHSNVSGSVASVVLLPGESVNVSDAISCNPVTDANWLISDDRFCANNEELNIGKGNITILPGGFLTLTQGTNITAEHLEYQRTGDAVAVNKGSELIIKGSK